MHTHTNFDKKIISVLFGLLILLSMEAKAHYIVVSGKLFYHSLLCEESLKGVQNPDTNPAAVECNATGQVIEVLCENPTNHQVAPGNAATQTFSANAQVDQNDITGKGKATVQIPIDTDTDLLVPENCVNPNWHPIAALIRTALITMNTYECLDMDCIGLGSLYSTITWQCQLPPEFDFNDYPNNMPVPGETQYNCTTVSSQHVR